MIRVENLSLAFGEQIIFNNISFTFQNNQKIGLVGRNGSGKTTLLKLLADAVSAENNSVVTAKHQTIAYMPQHVVLQSEKTVFQEAYSTFAAMYALETKRQELEKALEENSSCTQTIEDLAAVLQALQEYNPQQARLKTEQVLRGLGFSEQQLHVKVETLSVGWKMRIILAKLLLQEADFYLFDEPTNHLDIFAKDWFLSFLKNAPFGFLLVCHERYFLDALCSQIYELEHGKGTLYHSNYSEYESQKKLNLEALQTAYEQQQHEISRKQATIDRFRAKASKARMAKSMEKSLAKIERIELPDNTPKSIHFKLTPKKQSGRVVLTVKNMAYSFGNKEIFTNASFYVERGQKIAVVAPNGVGKTTLFNTIAGIYQLQKGIIEFGYNVEHAIFHQDQDCVLNHELTILQEACSSAPDKTLQEIRTLLGCFLFTKEMAEKKIKVLSGGEKNRVSMVKVLLQDANFLLLDEPTNHLDLQSKEILLRVLQDYPGTILFVSHDHDFINNLATHIIELTSHGTKLFLGNYHDYQNQKNLTIAEPVTKQAKLKVIDKKQISSQERYSLEKESKRLEKKIEKLEQQIGDQQKKFADMVYASNQYQQAVSSLKTLESTYKETMLLWEQLQEQL